MYESGLKTGLPQKGSDFFGVASKNCQTDVKNM